MKEPVNKEAWRTFNKEAWRTFWLKEVTLDVEKVKKLLSLAEKTQTLWLSGFIDLDEDAAKLLAKHRGPLVLDGLRILSDGVARELAKHQGEMLSLNGLDTISDASANALSSYKSCLHLKGIKGLTAEAHQALSQNARIVWRSELEDHSRADRAAFLREIKSRPSIRAREQSVAPSAVAQYLLKPISPQMKHYVTSVMSECSLQSPSAAARQVLDSYGDRLIREALRI